MERKDLKAPNTQCSPSSHFEKLQSISVVSSDDNLSSKELRSQHDFGVPEFQNASQTLWDSGKLYETIPDGFYLKEDSKKIFNSVPSLDDLHTLDIEWLRPNVIVVDAHKDKKLFMLQQLAATLAKGLHSSPAKMVKKISRLVCDFFKRPKSESDPVEGALEEASHSLKNQGIHMLGQIKNGSCHSQAILFKVLADTIWLECRLMVGLPQEGVTDSC